MKKFWLVFLLVLNGCSCGPPKYNSLDRIDLKFCQDQCVKNTLSDATLKASLETYNAIHNYCVDLLLNEECCKEDESFLFGFDRIKPCKLLEKGDKNARNSNH